MGNGLLKPIEDIEPGDYVLAHDLETNQWRPQLVLDQWSHLDDGHMATVTIADGTTVTATDHHLFWNETDQTWTELDSVEQGDALLTPTGPVQVMTLMVGDVNQTLVWELTVATDHNFTVSTGTVDLLVHNQGDDEWTPLRGTQADEAAEALGYRRTKEFPFNSHGQRVYTNGKDFISPDVDGHNGGVWKKFDRRGRRVGTFDGDLKWICK